MEAADAGMDAADDKLVESAARMVQSAASRGLEVAANTAAFDEHMTRTQDAAEFIQRLPQMTAAARRVPGGLTVAEVMVANAARDAAVHALSVNSIYPCSVAAIDASHAFTQSKLAVAAALQARVRAGPGQSFASDASGTEDGIASHLTCVICSELLCYPLSLPCGHSSSCGVWLPRVPRCIPSDTARTERAAAVHGGSTSFSPRPKQRGVHCMGGAKVCVGRYAANGPRAVEGSAHWC